MSLTLITGSLQGDTYVGSWGQIYALTDSDIYIAGPIGEARFTLPKGSVFGAVALNGNSPFPNDILIITAYGQSQVLAVTTTATGGGGGTPSTGSALFSDLVLGVSPTGSEGNWRLITSGSNLEFQFWDSGSSNWITDTFLDGTPYSGSGGITTVSASYAATASYVDITGSGIIVNYVGSQIQLTGSGDINTGSLVSNVTDMFTTPSASYIVTLTSAEYTALGSKDSNTVYIVI
jgi:hypothetical protein